MPFLLPSQAPSEGNLQSIASKQKRNQGRVFMDPRAKQKPMKPWLILGCISQKMVLGWSKPPFLFESWQGFSGPRRSACSGAIHPSAAGLKTDYQPANHLTYLHGVLLHSRPQQQPLPLHLEHFDFLHPFFFFFFSIFFFFFFLLGFSKGAC